MADPSPVTPERIMQTAIAFWSSKTLLSAIEMGVFTELANGPQEFDSLSGRLGLHPRAARDFLDALVSLGFLSRSGSTYSNTPDTDLFLDRRKPTYLPLEMMNARLYPFWARLTEAVRTGLPQNESREDAGNHLFSTLYADPARLKVFLTAMTGLSHGANLAIARQVPWSRYKTFADVGTAQGDLAAQIALANPHLEGIGFDLAEVAPVFEEYVDSQGISGRVHFQSGDFFKQDLPRVDVLTMGHILHDCNLVEKKMLIAKAFSALNPGGALVVYDAIIDDDRSQNAFGLLMSLNMLI